MAEVDDVGERRERRDGVLVQSVSLTCEAELLLAVHPPHSFAPPGWPAGVAVRVPLIVDPVPAVL